jgi:Metal binding domain of Ada
LKTGSGWRGFLRFESKDRRADQARFDLEESAMSPLTMKAGVIAGPAGDFASDDERWDAVRRRDPAAVGAFVYGVATTGVYCRPSCGARLPRRENVKFHATCAGAEQAGFRPCKRCRPNETLPTGRNSGQKRTAVNREGEAAA